MKKNSLLSLAALSALGAIAMPAAQPSVVEFDSPFGAGLRGYERDPRTSLRNGKRKAGSKTANRSKFKAACKARRANRKRGG